jgi:hypothetical protein
MPRTSGFPSNGPTPIASSSAPIASWRTLPCRRPRARCRRASGRRTDDCEHVPGVYHALRRLPNYLDAAGVPRDPHFAAAAAHFEGWGCLHALEHTAGAGLFVELRARDMLPAD